MLGAVRRSRFPKPQHFSEYRRFEDVFVETEIEGEFIRVVIKESDQVIWDAKSMAATLIEVPGRVLELSVEKDNPYKLVHEIVSLGLTKNKTDRKLKDLVEPPYDPSRTRYLNMTPDYIEMVGGEMLIGELGTKNTRSENTLSETYRMKFADLSEKVRGSGLKNDLFCIIVSPTMVYSNLELSIDHVDVLCSLFRLGEQVFLRVCNKYGISSSEDKLGISEFKAKIGLLSDKIKLPDSDNPLIISDSMIDHWYKEMATLEVSDVSGKILKECMTEARKYTLSEYSTESFERDFQCLSNLVKSEGSKIKKNKAFKVPFFNGDISGKKRMIGPLKNEMCNKYISLINMVSGQFQEKSSEKREIFENDEQWSQTNTRGYGFVHHELDESSKIEFAKLGLFAKGKVNKELRTESKLQISLESDVSLISEFLSSDILREESSLDDCLEHCFSQYDSIVKQTLAEEDVMISRDLISFESRFKKTRLGKICMFYTLLFQELNYLIAKVSSKKGFYLNRISETNWFVVSHPTGTHLFYTLFRLNDGEPLQVNNLFDIPVVNNPEITIFPWRSTDKDRVSSMLNIYENMLLLRSDILSHYGYEENELSDAKVKFTFLMNCDNKQTTADILYLWREMLVKFCSGDPYSRPGILFSKMPKIRSLLGVFILKQMLLVGSNMIANRPIRREKSAKEETEDELVSSSNDHFENLYDLISGLKEDRFENAMYTSYLACYHSYATMSKLAADFKVAEKIVEYELKLRHARADKMWKDSDYGDVRDHEFNLKLSLFGGLLRRKLLRDIYSDTLETHIYRILQDSMTKSFLEFGTFKASLERFTSNVFSPLTPPKTHKALETLKTQFHIYETCVRSPYEDFSFIERFIDEGVHAKIDKKMDQAKGLREILTMDMRSRFFLNIIERFMEKLNRDSPSEVLSKGDQKIKIIKTIDEAVCELAEDGYDLFVIDQIIDHSKWCQFFVMNKFATHLAPILPKPIFRIFCAILNKVTKKKIFLSNSMLLKLSQTDKIFSESLSELRKQFMGKSEECDLIDSMTNSLKNMSNMGQGWLQNLSGSDGDTDMQTCSVLMETWLRSMKNRGIVPDDTRVFNFRISSSDDQRQRKIIKIRKGYEKVAQNYLRLVGIAPMVISKHSCKKMSMEKSELFSMNSIGEFNQYFTSGNMNFVGSCKFTRAALEIPVTVSLADRFFNFANTRRNLLENGIDIFTSSMAQLMQVRVHYRSLGMAVDPLFSEYRKLVEEWDSPYLGFFPWERCNLLGMFGNEIARYDNAMKSAKSRYMMQRLLSSLDLRMGARGELGPSISFRITKKDKFKSFLQKFDMDLKYLEKRPHVLYLGAENRLDTWNLINAKAYLAEAELAFVFDSSSKVFSSSFLILREPVVKLSVESGSSRNPKRCNIFGLANYLSEGFREIAIEYVLPVFSNSSLFEAIRAMTPDMSNATPVRHIDLARRKSTFHMSNVVGGMEIPLIDCVKEIWFGKHSGHNSKLTLDSFLSYRQMFPWLRDTHDDTMRNGLFNFENPFQLKNTLESIRESEKRFSVVSPLRQSSLDRMVRDYQKFNYKRGHVLRDIGKSNFSVSRDSDMYRVARIINGPFTKEEKIGALSDLDLSKYMPQFDNNISRRKLYSLWLIEKSKYDKSISKKDIISSILQSSRSYVPYFKVPQRKDKNGRFTGNMILDLIFENNLVQIEYISNKIKIVSSGSVFLNSKSREIYDLLVKMGFSDCMTNSGMRLTESGLSEKTRLHGFPVEIRKVILTVDSETAKLDLDYDIGDTGKVSVQLSTSKYGFSFDFSFFINDWTISGITQEDVKGYEEKWINNVPLNVQEMRSLIRDHPKWAKASYKNYMDGIVLPNQMLESRMKEEAIELTFDIGIFDIAKIDKVTDMTDLDDFIGSSGILEEISEENFANIQNLDFKLNVHDLDVNQFEYFDDVKLAKLNNNLFKNMNSELLYMSVYELYGSEYRLPITSSDPWFEMFCNLTGYMDRPLLQPKSFIEQERIDKKETPLRLGEDRIVVETKGDRFRDSIKPAVDLFDRTILFMESEDLPAKGIYVTINGKKTQLKLTRFGKYDILNQFTDFILDKIGVETEIVKLTDRRTGEVAFSKEEKELSDKVERHWKRYDRYKDDFVFDSRLGEFFVENPDGDSQ